MPAYCVAANCNNCSSIKVSSFEMHKLDPFSPHSGRFRGDSCMLYAESTAVRRKWIQFAHFKRADFDAALSHAHLCSEHFAECDFANCIEYRIYIKAEFELKPIAFSSVQKASKQIAEHLKQNER